MGQYGRAALSVAPTHKIRLLQTTVSKKKNVRLHKYTLPRQPAAATPLKEGGFGPPFTPVPTHPIRHCVTPSPTGEGFIQRTNLTFHIGK